MFTPATPPAAEVFDTCWELFIAAVVDDDDDAGALLESGDALLPPVAWCRLISELNESMEVLNGIGDWD